ncbi:hypothetical protein REPUB_Repub04eG0125500 [Reevesia pubescens]
MKIQSEILSLKVLKVEKQNLLCEKFGLDESCHPEFDPQSWCQAIGGIETTCTHVYGFGTTPRARDIFYPSSSTIETSFSTCAPTTRINPSTSSADVEHLKEEVATVKEDVSVVKDRLGNLVQSQDEIKEILLRMSNMFDSNRLHHCDDGASHSQDNDSGSEDEY